MDTHAGWYSLLSVLQGRLSAFFIFFFILYILLSILLSILFIEVFNMYSNATRYWLTLIDANGVTSKIQFLATPVSARKKALSVFTNLNSSLFPSDLKYVSFNYRKARKQ